jgi:hypothetical protein
MMENKEVVLVVYDNMGKVFFLILQNEKNKTWELPSDALVEGETPEKAGIRVFGTKTGISRGKITKKIELIDNTIIMLIETSMNIPVHPNVALGYNNYLWSSADSVDSKLNDKDKERFLIALSELNNVSKSKV